jgi:hypothetical protein
VTPRARRRPRWLLDGSRPIIRCRSAAAMERVGGHLTVKPFDRHHDMASGQGPARCGVITAALSGILQAARPAPRISVCGAASRISATPMCNLSNWMCRVEKFRASPAELRADDACSRAADSAAAAEAHSIEGVDEAALETQKGFHTSKSRSRRVELTRTAVRIYRYRVPEQTTGPDNRYRRSETDPCA